MNGWPTAMTVFEARHAAQGGTTTTAKTGNSAAPRHQGTKAAGQPKTTTKARRHHRLACGQMAKRSAALAARGSSTAEVRHGLSVPTGKPADMAASGHPCGALRPGRITPGRLRQPPAQPGACARHARNVRGNREAVKTGLSGKRGQHPRIKQASVVRRGRKKHF